MNVEQQRAAEAFRLAGEGAEGSPEKFLGLARSLPAMLQTNGLLATWAFLLRERKDPKKPKNPAAPLLLQALRKRLEARVGATRHAQLFPGADPEAGFLRIGETGGGPALSGTELRLLTEEGIRYAVWIKRAAEALCDGASAPAARTSPEEGR